MQRLQWALWTALAVYVVLSLRWEALLPRQLALVGVAVCLFLATPVSRWREPLVFRWPGLPGAMDYLITLLLAATAVAALVAVGDAALQRVFHNGWVIALAVASVCAYGLRRLVWGVEADLPSRPDEEPAREEVPPLSSSAVPAPRRGRAVLPSTPADPSDNPEPPSSDDGRP